MAKLSNIERHYLKHKEDLRLTRRHGQVEAEVTMHFIHKTIVQLTGASGLDSEGASCTAGGSTALKILDVGAGTGRYAIALKNEGHEVKAVELVAHNIEVMRSHDPSIDAVKGDARNLREITDDYYDITLLLGPLYHLFGDEEKLKALQEARRVTRKGGRIFVGYLLNEYSILQYCFDENRMPGLLAGGNVDENFHIRAKEGELYDYLRLDDINRLNAAAGLTRERIFSPEGAADFMRTRLNRMSEETFRLFIQYQLSVAERPDLLGAGSHVVDVLVK